MLWLTLLLACPRETAPAPVGSRSGELALHAGDVARRAQVLAARTEEIEGWMDEWRGADPARREEIVAEIRVRAAEVHAEAVDLQGVVEAMEAGAQAWPSGQGAAGAVP